MKNPFRVVSTREVYRNAWLSLHEDVIVRPSGQQGVYGVVNLRPGSSVLALDSEQHVYLVREFKYAVQRATLEIVSGGIEESESPLETAQRELAEEAGLAARRWIDLGCIDPFTAAIQSPNYLFLALDVEPRPRSLDDGEVIDVVRMPFHEAFARMSGGEITHAATCVLLLRADRWLRGLEPMGG